MSTEAPVPALVLAATPIGDPTDAAPRLTHELASAPLILAEDTRRTKRLCDALGVTHRYDADPDVYLVVADDASPEAAAAVRERATALRGGARDSAGPLARWFGVPAGGILDIVPTGEVWARANRAFALGY